MGRALGDRLSMPKLSVDSKLKEGGDQTAEIVTKDFTENLVDLRGLALMPRQ